VELVLTRDAEELADRAERFLAERIERNVIATILAGLRHGGPVERRPLFAYAPAADGGVRAVALRTPPWPLLCSELSAGDADALLARWLIEDPEPPGVSATTATARAIAGAWQRQTGGSASVRMRQAMHVLARVSDPPRPADGSLRAAAAQERERLIAWERAFASEAGVAAGEQAAALVDARLAAGSQFIWQSADGTPVCTLAAAPVVAGTARIGPVYTPPEHRRHGYAGSAVAALSRRLLAGGASRCMLFTDLANPTSNRIYASVGFRRIADWEEYAFARADALVGEPPAPISP
jgi:predicted GNAT family acetyltransferase